jgi:tetratricopeptide (TPR) repeat protein
MENEHDPRGWLAACPELTQFASDPPIAAAIAAGDARRLQRALEKRRKGRRGALEARTIDAILAKRRLFTMPVAKAPTLSTVNGIGARVYGRSDRAADGSYVGTLFFTLLYLPIWPIAQYVLWSQGREYSFFGEVPLSRTMRIWRHAAAAVLAAGAAAIALAIWQGGSTAKVHLLNGLDEDVSVEVAGHTTRVAKNGRSVATVPVGSQKFRALAADGRVLEEIQADVPRWTDLVAYNPLGAAVLYVDGIVYVADGKKPPADAPDQHVIYAGTSFVARDHVDYVFQPAPQKVDMRSKSDRETRWHADVLRGGWTGGVNALAWDGRLADAASLAARMAKALPKDPSPQVLRVLYENWAHGSEAALAAARDAAAAFPDEADLQRHLVALLGRTGRADEAARMVRARAEREPGSALAAYLVARTLPVRAGVPAFEALARRFPDDPNVRRGLAWAYLSTGRFPEATRELEHFARLDPAETGYFLEPLVVSLVHAGRARDALVRVEATADGDPGDIDVAILHAQLARLVATPPRPPAHYLDAIAADKEADAWLKGMARAQAAALLDADPPKPAELDGIAHPRNRAAAEILSAAGRDPDRALALAAKARPDAFANVGRGVCALLAGEAARRGDAALADRIAGAAMLVEAPSGALVAFVRGEDPEALEGAHPAVRAGLLLARARAAEAAGRDARALYAAAREAYPLGGAVAVAMARWPKPVAGPAAASR